MKFNIVVGSVLGASEYVAEAIEAKLQSIGHSTECHFTPDLNHIDVSDFLIVVSSTHGAGDLPENIEKFAEQVKQSDLSNSQAIVIGLGDSSYDTFCEASLTIESILKNAGATVVLPVFQIDVLHHPIPEDVAVEWLDKHLPQLNLV